MTMFKNSQGRYRTGWIIAGLLLITTAGVVLGSLLIRQRSFDSATNKPADGTTYTRNVLFFRKRRR